MPTKVKNEKMSDAARRRWARVKARLDKSEETHRVSTYYKEINERFNAIEQEQCLQAKLPLRIATFTVGLLTLISMIADYWFSIANLSANFSFLTAINMFVVVIVGVIYGLIIMERACITSYWIKK